MLRKMLKWLGMLLGALILLFILLLLVPERETVPTIQPRESTAYWNMEEGFKIAYTHLPAADTSAKTPIIFLHGGPGGYVHSSIIHTLGQLTPLGHELYFYDQRGSGLSDRLERFSDVSFEKHLQDLHEIITEKIGAEKVILIGQSFGSNLIAHYSARHPERLEQLIFSSPGTFLPYRKSGAEYVDLDSLYPGPDSLHFIEPYNFVDDVNSMAAKPKAIVATLGALLLDKKLVSDRQMDRMLNTLASRFTRGMVCDEKNVLPEEGGGGLYAYLATNSGDYPEIRPVIQGLSVPVLVLQGQCEYHSYAAAYEYADLYAESQYQFIEGAGHEIWWEQEEQYLAAIRAFLEEH